MASKERKDGRFRIIDLLVILLCLFGAASSIYLFYLDLFATLDSKNKQPVGTIIIKSNIVQRRLEDRVLWDRLAVESPVYLGDLIRTANHSTAALHIEDSSIDLDENTLIRILRARDGTFEIELSGGVLGLSSGAEGQVVTLNVMGRQVEATPGTVLNATAGDDGIVVQVSEGSAFYIEEEQRIEILSGTMIALDAQGFMLTGPAIVVRHPQPNARYLKNSEEPLNIPFAWNRINFGPEEALRMEIAEDGNFNNAIWVIENLSSTTEAALNVGLWHWRLLYDDTVMSSGRFTITDAAGPHLESPAMDSLFRYQNDNPQLRFQWSEIEEASQYIVEIGETPDLMNPRLHVQTTATFLIESSLGPGTWYWRVMPAFPSVYEGSASFSPVAFFHIEQDRTQEPMIIVPESTIIQPELAIVQPEPELEPVPEPPVPILISLLSPTPGASLPGLTALRQQTVFTWDSDGEVTGTRFIISHNANPLLGQPVRTINNPGRTIRLDSLQEGVYYWTIEAQSPDGLISVAEPRQLRVLAIPLLPAPGNLRPSADYYIGIEQLRTQRNIVFSWATVQGANAYIFTLYEQTTSGRRAIISRPPENRTTWTLDDIGVLNPGTYVWQVEAVNRNASGTIEQRGRTGGNSFILDVPTPGPVRVEEPGILYGN